MIDGRDLIVASTANEHYLVANFDTGNTSNVDDGEVHGDAAEHRSTVVAQEHISTGREAAVESVAIAGGNDGDARWSGCDVAPVVSDGLACRHVAQREHAGLPGHDTNETEGMLIQRKGAVSTNKRQFVTVNGHAGTDKIEPTGAPSQSGAAIGKMKQGRTKPQVPQRAQSLGKALLLQSGFNIVEHFGRGEVAEDAFELHFRNGFDARGKFIEL